MEMACQKQCILQHLLRLLLYLLIFIANISKALANPRASNNSATAVIVFGDSTVDPGNNNYVTTIFKADFPPYGKDFPNQVPTGRFSNGRLTPDFIASYIGIKQSVPPYLDPTLSIEELMTGVSFASAGSGFDPLTPKISNVVDMPKQLEYFKEYKKRLESAIGKKKTENHIKKALFIVSAGTNDFVVNYFTLPSRRKSYSISAYQQFIVQTAVQFLQDLFEQGARKILFAELAPMGCLPVVITLFSDQANILERGCVDYFSSVGRQFNLLLQKELNLMQIRLANHGFKIFTSDAYGAVTDMIQGQGRSAFDEVNRGCCGTGYMETAILCNPKSFLCPDASKYVFWDSIHPTEQAKIHVYKFLASLVGPLYLSSLFFNKSLIVKIPVSMASRKSMTTNTVCKILDVMLQIQVVGTPSSSYDMKFVVELNTNTTKQMMTPPKQGGKGDATKKSQLESPYLQNLTRKCESSSNHRGGYHCSGSTITSTRKSLFVNDVGSVWGCDEKKCDSKTCV